jgi:hypothetical protein
MGMLKKLLLSMLVITFLIIPAEAEPGEYQGIVLVYPQSFLKAGENTGTPSLYLVDSLGGYHHRPVNPEVHVFFMNDYTHAAIGKNGSITNSGGMTEGRELSVIVLDREHRLVGNATLWLDHSYAGFKMTLDRSYPETDQEVAVSLTLLDVLRQETQSGSLTVAAVPAAGMNGKVSIKLEEGINEKFRQQGTGRFFLAAEQPGLVELDVTVSGGKISFTQRLAIEYYPAMPPKVVLGAREVLMFLGTTGYLRDGKLMEIKLSPFIMEGRVFVPVRPVAESFQAKIEFAQRDSQINLIVLRREDRTVSIPLEQNFVHVQYANGMIKVIKADAPARIVAGRTVIPFRAIAEAFDTKVDFGRDDNGGVKWVRFTQ